MIGIAATQFDVLGAVVFKEDMAESDMESLSRRGSKAKTLDGGVYIEDLGFSDSDRDFKIKVNNPTIAQVDTLKYLVRTYSTLLFACREGVFLGLITDLTVTQDVRFTFKISERISQEP